MLVRLQNAIGRDDLMEQMVLHSAPTTPLSEQAQSEKSLNLIVGYNSSPRSHTALDITLLIAHQTRLATKAQVTVQVVYVLEDNYVLENNQSSDYEDILQIEEFATNTSGSETPLYFPANSAARGFGTPVLTQIKLQANPVAPKRTSVDQFTQAECILRQAICLAQEWKSSFKAHLRFGCVATELNKVVASESANLLILGCNSANHPLVGKLGSHFPCSVLGIPNCVDDKVH
ncbi:MAG: universal stress protein [Stigonema ocellatum SAG 48.90 = DSM 106950]|nr:universal stress protein [Stigonema ocellatum SAG 48.90 = DSM 106950]